MTVKLFISAMTKFVLGFILVALLLFVPAGTLDFPGGWVLMAVLFIPMFTVGIVLMIKNPELLKRRLDAKETLAEQDIIVKLSAVMFVLGFVAAGLDFRFSITAIPTSFVTAAVVIFLLSYLLYGEVIRENLYLSRTIKTFENQKVIDTGLYSIVRHPMYSATIFLFLSIPVILGSYISFFIFLFYPFIISKRVKYEEEFLERELEGYTEYKQKVKYKLLPFIW